MPSPKSIRCKPLLHVSSNSQSFAQHDSALPASTAGDSKQPAAAAAGAASSVEHKGEKSKENKHEGDATIEGDIDVENPANPVHLISVAAVAKKFGTDIDTARPKASRGLSKQEALLR